MEQKGPLDIGLKLLNNLGMISHNEHRFITPDFGFVNSFAKMESKLLATDQPYRVKEGRIILIQQGTVRVLINLIEYTLHAGDLSILTPNSILQLLEVSTDFDMQIIAIERDFLLMSGKEDLFSYLLYHQKKIILTLSWQEQKQIENYFILIWDILHKATFLKEAVAHLSASLLYYIEDLTQNDLRMNPSTQTRQESVFEQFISLVNTYSKTERTVGFYADKLCLTPRYLNTLIRQTSNQTVMDWINQSIILEAKVLLKHSKLLIYQISDELNFPNPSFFCKFFKRMTGMTPQEYQKK